MRSRSGPEQVRRLRDLLAGRFQWQRWERLISQAGITLDRPRGAHHPSFPEIVYPIDYGYINGTDSGDGDQVDVFVGSARNGLVALLLTTDFRKGDREFKLLYNCRPDEIYLVNGFINFDRTLMEGLLILRHPMAEYWALEP